MTRRPVRRRAPGHATGRLALRLLRDVGPPLLLSRLALLVITLTAPQWRWTVPDPAPYLSPTPRLASTLLTRWYHWDAAWYLRIAGNGPRMGYSRFTENSAHGYGAFAFFPLYPLSVRGLAWALPGVFVGAFANVPMRTTGPPQALVVAGLIAANVTFIAALVALYLLAYGRAGPAAARRAVWLLCLFPTTVFFAAPYSESLFLLWLALFFAALERRHWWLAGLCGALAAATRSLGAALVVPYLAACWQARRYGHTSGGEGDGALDAGEYAVASWWEPLLPAVVIPLGLLGYMAYLRLAWGDPLLFQEAEKAWGRSLAAPWVGIVDGLRWSLQPWPHLPQPYWRGLVDALYALVFLGLSALAWRGMVWTERAYTVIFWLYVLCTPQINDPRHPDTLISMPRFLLALLPLWLWLARERRRSLAMALPSAVLLLVYAGRWVNGAWIG